MDDLENMDACAQAELVARREVKPSELLDAAIERIERVNPEVNAVVTTMYDEARAAIEAGLPEGPFTGVPFLLKDLIAAYAGVRMTYASEFMKDFVPDHDSELVRRLKRAGLVIAGKANTPEYGILPTTEPRLHGPCRNPWDLSRSTGGSSGGSAAAVASRMVPMAHANDAGGSIRIPASCCGVFGLKPTRARNPLGPDLGDIFGGLVCEHAETISVRDSAALLDATAGPDIGDPYPAPPVARPFLDEVGADPGTLRIAFTKEAFTGAPVHPDCVAAVTDAAGLLRELGHDVADEQLEMDLDVETAVQAFTGAYIAGCAWSVEVAARLSGGTPTEDVLEPLTWTLYQMGKGINSVDYLLATAAIQGVSRQVARAFEPYDVVLMPTITEPPYPLGSFEPEPDNPMAGLLRSALVVPFTAIGNFTGMPAMSVPLYWNSEGLPIGTQYVGRFGDEATLFRLAAQLEEARPWAGRKPHLSA